MGSFSTPDGFDPDAAIGFDLVPGVLGWVGSRPEMGSIRIPDGSVPKRVAERAAWGRVALGSSQDPPCHEGTIIRDGPSRPDRREPAATVP